MVLIWITDASGCMINAITIPTKFLKIHNNAKKYIRIVENGASAWGQIYYVDRNNVYMVCSSNTTIKLFGIMA